MILRARWVLPVASPPIENGEVIIEDGFIEAVRPSVPGTTDALEFGDAVLLPGLINAHTHLELTLMRGLLEDVDFFPWVRQLTTRKAALTPEDWKASATWGAIEAAAGGVTTIGDCTDSGAALDGALAVGLGGVIYQEVFGIDPCRSVNAIM
ncbi:MAG TPA: amidohydrolase family protein, partial [Chthonomonadales bacterium]|nr:amidohydrolase family protein [Chthonomonadales bacterium]